jgi:hypothetical protein
MFVSIEGTEWPIISSH